MVVVVSKTNYNLVEKLNFENFNLELDFYVSIIADINYHAARKVSYVGVVKRWEKTEGQMFSLLSLEILSHTHGLHIFVRTAVSTRHFCLFIYTQSSVARHLYISFRW